MRRWNCASSPQEGTDDVAEGPVVIKIHLGGRTHQV